MSAAATDEQLTRVTHFISDDGLRLLSRYDGPEGVVKVVIGWPDIETARAHYADAAHSFRNRLGDLIAKVEAGEDSQQRLRRFGPLQIIVDAGPPIWLLPKAWLRDSKGNRDVAFGWLYRAYHFSLRGRS